MSETKILQRGAAARRAAATPLADPSSTHRAGLAAAEAVPGCVLSAYSADAALDQEQMLLVGVKQVKAGHDPQGMNARKLRAAIAERLLRNPKVGRVGEVTIVGEYLSGSPERDYVRAGARASAGAGNLRVCKVRREGMSAHEARTTRRGV